MTTTLDRWMTETKTTDVEMARRLCVHHSYVGRLRRAERMPSRAVAGKLAAETGQPWHEFMEPPSMAAEAVEIVAEGAPA